MKKFWDKEKFWVALAGALRLAFISTLSASRLYQIDEGGFVFAARRLAQTGSFGPHAISPLAPAFFAVFFRCFGPSFLFPRLGEAAAGVLTAWVTGRMAATISGSRAAGILALAISAVYPFFIYYNGLLMSETLYTLAATAGLWLFVQGFSPLSFSLPKWVLANVFLGLAALARPEAQAIIPGLWCLSAIFFLRKKISGKALAAGVLFSALPIAAWCARNKISAGTLKLDDHGGMTLLHGTMFLDLNEVDTELAMRALKKTPFYQNARSLPEAERDKIYYQEAFKFMAAHPEETLRQWAYKFISFWRFYPRMNKKYIESGSSRPNLGLSKAVLAAISLLFEPWLIIGGLIGLSKLVWRKPEAFCLAVFLLGTMAVHMISVSQMRYRLPVMPLLIVGFSALAAEKMRLWLN
ncbi:MAG: ArnT family glycosyltransferase [Elusimicrobiota bacterium]